MTGGVAFVQVKLLLGQLDTGQCRALLLFLLYLVGVLGPDVVGK